MEISINYKLINSIEDLRLFSRAFKEGLIMKPNISKLARTLNADRKTVRKTFKRIYSITNYKEDVVFRCV